MAKKKHFKLSNLILMVAAIAGAVLAYIGLFCNFITRKTTASALGGSTTVTTEWNLKDWFANIDALKDSDKIGNWKIASVLLIILAILIAVMLVVMLLKGFSQKNSLLKWTTFGLASATFACAVAFLILIFTGCNTMSTKVDLLLAGGSSEYWANIGVYFYGIGALVASSIAAAVAIRK